MNFCKSNNFITQNGGTYKFYPKYNYIDLNQIHNLQLNPDIETRIKVTRPSEYGERYKLFVIEKNTFEKEFNLEDYGISLIKEDDKVLVDTVKWNGKAKKSGIDMGDYITEFKTENYNRPDKKIITKIMQLDILIFYLVYLNFRF